MPGKSKIMHAVREGLDGLFIEGGPEDYNSNAAWTKSVKTELCKIGRRFRYEVCAGGLDQKLRDYPEWLYDVTWLEYEEPPGGGNLIDAPLVAECEWGKDQDVYDDFDKLLLARAGVRLMIFDAENMEDSAEVSAKYLAERIRNFNGYRTEDAWLLAAGQRTRIHQDWRFRYFMITNIAEVHPFPRE